MEKSQQLQGLCKASGVFLAPKMAAVMEEVMLDGLALFLQGRVCNTHPAGLR